MINSSHCIGIQYWLNDGRGFCHGHLTIDNTYICDVVFPSHKLLPLCDYELDLYKSPTHGLCPRFVKCHPIGYKAPIDISTRYFELHIGNYLCDTDGCGLVGAPSLSGDMGVTESRRAFNLMMKFFPKLRKAETVLCRIDSTFFYKSNENTKYVKFVEI